MDCKFRSLTSTRGTLPSVGDGGTRVAEAPHNPGACTHPVPTAYRAARRAPRVPRSLPDGAGHLIGKLSSCKSKRKCRNHTLARNGTSETARDRGAEEQPAARPDLGGARLCGVHSPTGRGAPGRSRSGPRSEPRSNSLPEPGLLSAPPGWPDIGLLTCAGPAA